MRKSKKAGSNRERRAKQQASQLVFSRGASLDMQRVYKIAAERSDQKYQNNRLRTHKILIYLSAIIAVILLIIYLFATKINNVSIKPVDARINQTSSRRYQDSVVKSMGLGWFGSFKPFVNDTKIVNNLKKTYPEIASVKLKTNPFSNNLMVEINFKKPALIWQTKNGQRFYVSDSGQTFKINYSQVGDDSLVKLFDTSGLSTAQGKFVVSGDVINFVTSVNKQLRQLNINVSQYNIPISSKEIDVKLAGKPYTIKLLSSNDAGQEVVQLKQSLGFFKKHPDQTPQKYLDLRIIGKAFYQ